MMRSNAKSSPTLLEPRRKAGRPRDPDVDEAILRATAELLGEAGYASLSIEGVAQRADVGRPSIYRRWPSKLHLVAALMREVSASAPLPDTGSLRGDLLALYRLYARYLVTPGGPIVPALVAEAMHDDELATVVKHYVDERRVVAMGVFDRAIARGEMRPDVDAGMLIDLISGFFWYRKLIRRASIKADAAGAFVDVLLAGIAAG
jgi:AcrR family transcriptional regulator